MSEIPVVYELEDPTKPGRHPSDWSHVDLRRLKIGDPVMFRYEPRDAEGKPIGKPIVTELVVTEVDLETGNVKCEPREQVEARERAWLRKFST